MAGKSPKAININPKTGEKYKLTMKELVAKQAAGGSLNKVQTQRLQAAGKLAPPPSAPAAKQKQFKFTEKELMQRLAAGIPLGPKQIKRLQKSGKIAPSADTPLSQLGPKQLQQAVGSRAGAGAGQFMDIIGQQGAFQPGSFKEQMDAAYQNVMNQYEQTMAPEFQREQADFQQMAAERGLDPNSEAYRTLQTQLNQRQDQARQGAMQSALQASQNVQAQGFGQALQGYQVPASMLEAFVPYWGGYGNYMQNMAQNKLRGKEMLNAQELAEIGISRQLTFDEQQQLEAQRGAMQYAAQNSLNAQNIQPEPDYINALITGGAAGVGAGIGNWMSTPATPKPPGT